MIKGAGRTEVFLLRLRETNPSCNSHYSTETFLVTFGCPLHMKFGFCLPSAGILARPEPLIILAQRAEELGFYAISFSDHIVMPASIAAAYPYSDTGKVAFPPDCLEQLTTLSFLAAK